MTTLRKSLIAVTFAVLSRSLPCASAPLSPAWIFPPDGSIAPVSSSPTVYQSIVFVGSNDGSLYALHATGALAGTLLPGFPISLDGAIMGRPAVYGDLGSERVYVATSAGSLYAFTLDGSPAWSRTPQPVCPGVPIVSTPAVRGKYVYATATNGRIIRRLAADGSPAGGLTYGRVVETTVAGRQPMPPLQSHLDVADAGHFFPTGRVTLIAKGFRGGQIRAEFTYTGKNTAVRPNRLLNVLPVGSGMSQAVLDADSAVVGFGPGASASASPAVPGQADATLVIAALDTDLTGARAGFGRNIVALKSEDYGLVPQWEAAYGKRITAAPTVDHTTGNLFIATWNDSTNQAQGGMLYCLHASNGQPAWPGDGAVPLSGGVLKATPWFESSRQVIYFGSTDGTMHGVRAGDGSPAFPSTRLDGAAGSFESTPVVVNGTAYIGSSRGRFYAVSIDKPEDYSVFVSPFGGSFDSSPSASGSEPGKDVVVLGSTAGKIVAFTVR